MFYRSIEGEEPVPPAWQCSCLSNGGACTKSLEPILFPYRRYSRVEPPATVGVRGRDRSKEYHVNGTRRMGGFQRFQLWGIRYPRPTSLRFSDILPTTTLSATVCATGRRCPVRLADAASPSSRDDSPVPAGPNRLHTTAAGSSAAAGM